MAAIKLFGFTLGNKDIVQKEKPEQASFALKTEALDDGAVTITQNAHYGTYVDLEGAVRNELELITRYREMANHPECDQAITEIVDEAITHEKDGTVVDIKMDNLKQPDSIKKKIAEEFGSPCFVISERQIRKKFGEIYLKTPAEAKTVKSCGT